MNHVLVMASHPNLPQSTANRTILERVQAALPSAEVVHLDALYPDGKILVQDEQARLMQADVIVLQFPFYWYSYPALLKKWIDEVFVFGFAHGTGGDKLAGKPLIFSLTTGAAAEQYQPDGAMHHRIEDFFPAFKQLASLCQMVWQEPVYSNGMMAIAGVSDAAQFDWVRQKAEDHAERLLARIADLEG